ncbi:MAG: PrsW family glutamic-type intramembrane protease [Chloroflexi bacterium]|nr:PrsW family glutamic-type intramembrane protease [Chloroflexota bacterium]
MQPNPNFNRRREILLLILSGIGILGLLIRSATLAVTGILTFDPGYGSSLAASVLGALGMLFCAGLLLPVLVYTIKRMKGQEILPGTIRPVKFWQVAVLVAVWVLVVIIGAVLASLFAYGWAVAAPLFLLGISLPILSLVWIGAGGLPGGSRRRLWSVYGFGMVGGTVAALLLEYLVIGSAVVVIGILAVANPELLTVIDQIKTQVANANAGDMQALLTVLAPYLTNPLVILSILVFAAVLAPLIEEAVKPAVIWFLGKRLRSPAEGFVLGALCGAGFAMMEGLMAASSATQMWGFGLAGRGAASLMHITSSGLLGWAIASAQLEKRYGRLALTYLLSVSLHGLWNGSAIMAVYGALRMMTQNMQIDFPGVLFMLGGIGMLFLELVLLLTALPLINRRLRQSAAPVPAPVQSDIIAPLATSNPRETNGLDS